MSKDFENCGIIGKGTFGLVRKVKKDDQFYAEKRVEISDKSLRELKFMKDADHVNIVKLFYYEKKRKYIYFYLKIAEYGDLKKFFANSSPIRKKIMKGNGATFLFLKQIFSALKYLHENDIMHRDLKPGNVLCYKPFEGLFPIFKLADFGLVKDFDKDGERITHTYCGTEIYMAPEVLQCRYTFSADIWSLGALVSYWCNGKHLFKDVSEIVHWNSKTCPLPERYRQDIRNKVTEMLNVVPESRPTACELNNFIPDVEKVIFSKFGISLLECVENLLSRKVLFLNNLNNNCSKSKGGELCDNNEKMVVDVNQPPYKSEENRSINNEGMSLSIHASRSVPWELDLNVEEEMSIDASNNIA